jgi:hypothetical protein
MIMRVRAINQKHQSQTNKAMRWLLKYNDFNDARDIEENTNGDETKLYKKLDSACIKAFDRFEDYLSELPKREIKNIENSELY